MHIASEYYNRNMSGVKMAYLLKARCDLCLWNAESNIILESCLLVLRTAFSMGGSDVMKKKWHRYTHTQTHRHTHTQRDKQVPLQALTQHKHNLTTINDHHTAQVLNTTSKLYDGIQCRLTARTAGSAKGEILDWELGNKQIDRVNTQKSITRGHNNRLQTITVTEHDTLCIICGLSEINSRPTKTIIKL
jgi:hypothetical protein